MRSLILPVLMLAAAIAAAQTPSGNAANGKVLFDTKYRCYTCHGFDGHGGQGARLVPMKLAQAAFIAYVRNPRQMPPYGAKIVPDSEMADIYAYIKSLPESPDVKSIPLLNSLLNP
jgi:mono/diheme cytochrome c family protein